MLLTPLEQRFPEQVYPANIQGIIVLGGSYDTVSHGYMSTIVLQEDTEPLAVMAISLVDILKPRSSSAVEQPPLSEDRARPRL